MRSLQAWIYSRHLLEAHSHVPLRNLKIYEIFLLSSSNFSSFIMPERCSRTSVSSKQTVFCTFFTSHESTCSFQHNGPKGSTVKLWLRRECLFQHFPRLFYASSMLLLHWQFPAVFNNESNIFIHFIQRVDWTCTLLFVSKKDLHVEPNKKQ